MEVPRALPVGLHDHRNILIHLTLFKTFVIIGKISEKRQIITESIK